MKPGRFHDITDELARNKDYYKVERDGDIHCDHYATAGIDGTVTFYMQEGLGVHNARRAYNAIGKAIWLIEHHWNSPKMATLMDKTEALRDES
jgi:hypothetical protein